jgi:hypothetical protein
VATIAEIARHADVPVEAVLRVVNGDPVSEAYAERVKRAMAELGGGADEGVVDTLRVLAGESSEGGVANPPTPSAPQVETLPAETEASPAADVAGLLREDLLQSLERSAAILKKSVPGQPGDVYEALRVEVHPVAEHIGAVRTLVGELQQSFDGLRGDLGRERHERLRDIEVLIDLIVTSWQTVDRRLGRVEKMLERMQRSSFREGRTIS